MLNAKEQKIYDSIKINSDNDPLHPEFPPDKPKFPATPTYKIKVPGFTNIWLKDESKNPCGTHKDRLAWEIIVTYKHILEAKKQDLFKKELPQFSIISSGNAAYTIQTYFKKYDLPNLKVILDSKINKKIIESLKEIGCELYLYPLTKKTLTWQDILKITENPNGLDITSNQAFDPTTRFYDWLSYEILNENPDYVFVPFGTGNLYENILNVVKKEISSLNGNDPRLKGNITKLREITYFGATTNNQKSKADKLYSSDLPFSQYSQQWINYYKMAGYCSQKSNVIIIKEKYIDEALKIAQKNNITCEPSGISGLALLLQIKKQIPKDKKILIVNTGKSKY